jgi:uncharacterized SAM-binding protein YcdF (DUF218 family)
MPWNDAPVLEALAIAWSYMRLVHQPCKADAILSLGSFDPEVANVAATLWHDRVAPRIIMSGGIAHSGGLLDTGWSRPEAEVFAEIAISRGVPPEAILIERSATNTGENFVLARSLAAERGLKVDKLAVVAKPYMTRRGWATGRVAWPELELMMCCEDIDVESYFARDPNPERTLRALVGDLHRILVYPTLGYQEEQVVPPAVVEALRSLVAFGYGNRLVPGYSV